MDDADWDAYCAEQDEAAVEQFRGGDDPDKCFECDEFIEICLDCGHSYCHHCDDGCYYCARHPPGA